MAPASTIATANDLPMAHPLAGGMGMTQPFEDLEATHATYESRVFRFLLYSLRDRDEAMSLTQDTFLTAWRTRASFRGECSEVTWLMRIAVNLLRNHVRTERFKFWKATEGLDATELVAPMPDPRCTAEDSLAAQQELAAVWQRVQGLSPKQRTVFLLRFLDDLELPEIALATGQPLPTVKTHLYRALDHVRALREERRTRQDGKEEKR